MFMALFSLTIAMSRTNRKQSLSKIQRTRLSLHCLKRLGNKASQFNSLSSLLRINFSLFVSTLSSTSKIGLTPNYWLFFVGYCLSSQRIGEFYCDISSQEPCRVHHVR